MFHDLRSLMASLDEHGALRRVEEEISPHLEVGFVAKELARQRGPAVLFERVSGSSVPVLCNLFPTHDRVAATLGVDVEELRPHWQRALQAPVAPEIVDTGACQEVIVDRDVDIRRLIPEIVWHPGDGGPYISFGCSITHDPETGERNLGMYRIQMKGPDKLGMKLQPPQHGGVMAAKARDRGEPFPIAISIGAPPAVILATQAVVPYGLDETGIAGALMGAPVALVRCKTIDGLAPAWAEMVLECEVLPGIEEEEGPFGEFLGYYSGSAPRQVVRVKAITHRRQPIYLGTYEGTPPTNTHVMQAVAREPRWFLDIQQSTCPTVRDIAVTLGGGGSLHVAVAIHQQAVGQARNVALQILRSHLVKWVTVVDADVDVHDPVAVEWAIATRVQADRDILVMPGMANPHLDPSQPAHPTGVGCKMAIDATMPIDKPYNTIRWPAAFERDTTARWAERGVLQANAPGGTFALR